ncbi:MAG: 16S rRNA (cytidine(1402)-2'-O)-methyltransferase [Chitinivibrionales bacterium]
MSSLYLVATPIGNLQDISSRAIQILQHVTCILAEDTRVSRKLMDQYDIRTPLRAYHDFNKEKVTPGLIELLKDGSDMALITDAGSPAIADPGFYITREAINNNIPVVPVPGPSALIAAISASGLPCDRFTFENFLPPKSGKRKTVLSRYLDDKRTVIFFETPHRIVKVLSEIKEVLGEVAVVIARELTKMHEEFLRGTPSELLAHFEQKKPRGEMVVLFNSTYQFKKATPH